jgi:hypothetical protein
LLWRNGLLSSAAASSAKVEFRSAALAAAAHPLLSGVVGHRLAHVDRSSLESADLVPPEGRSRMNTPVSQPALDRLRGDRGRWPEEGLERRLEHPIHGSASELRLRGQRRQDSMHEIRSTQTQQNAAAQITVNAASPYPERSHIGM